MQEADSAGGKFEELLLRYRIPVILSIAGLIILGASVLLRKGVFSGGDSVEVLEEVGVDETGGKIVVEISGAVGKPGVYEFQNGDRVNDAFIKSGGLSASADRNWVEKVVNRASRLEDGQKIYVPTKNETSGTANQQSDVLSASDNSVYQNISGGNSSTVGNLININNADIKTLDALPGIGPVYAQKITEQRHYSSLEDFRRKSVVPASTYEKIKNLITVY